MTRQKTDISKTSAGKENDLICHCFEYTKNDIENDFNRYGYSTIIEHIQYEKKNKGCACHLKNPKGS